MEEILNAFDKNTLDRFILKKMLSSNEAGIQGRIKRNDECFIYVEINENDVQNLDFKAKYEIDFILNRLAYQVQHLALDYVQEHNLFEKFINNPLLDNPNDSIESMDEPNDSVQVERYLILNLQIQNQYSITFVYYFSVNYFQI